LIKRKRLQLYMLIFCILPKYMKLLSTLILFLSLFSFAQQKEIELHIQDSIPLHADSFLGIDAYQSIYYLKDDIVFKQSGNQLYSYQNNNLDAFTQIDFLNPLSITVLYANFNTVVQLDNTLSEIRKIEFNGVENFPNVSVAKSANNHRLWIFDQNSSQLEVYDYKVQQIKVVTQPITGKIIKAVSNYNYCWLLTSSKIVTYNIYGSLINSFDVSEFDNFWQQDDYFILRKDNQLFLLNKSSKTIEKIKLPKIKIKDVFVKAETVYIYNGIKLYTLNFKN